MTSLASRCSSTTMARPVNKPGACCAGQDIHDARRVADGLGIPHYVLDYESRFREAVMEDFADTPFGGAPRRSPYVRCNQTVKFADLMRVAKDLDADCLATGHYVRREEGANGSRIAPRRRPARPIVFPLCDNTGAIVVSALSAGGMPKPQVRALASEFGLQVAEKPDSQDHLLCAQRQVSSHRRKASARRD